MLKKIKIFFLFVLINSAILSNPIKDNDIAFITNQESSKLDIVDLKKKEKIFEIDVGLKPAAIDLDNENKVVFIANPESNNIFIYNLKTEEKYFVEAGKKSNGNFLSHDRKYVFVSNWYDNTVSVINYKKRKVEKNNTCRKVTCRNGSR